uniref:Putative SBP family protein n=1 Tax=Davidia involucrata TaxID=16924 RepID=A0A5B7CCP2_DAVIN
MAVQAQLYPENLGLPMCGSQDWLMSSILGIDDGVHFNLQEQPQHTTQFHQHQSGFQSLGLNNSNREASCSSTGDQFLAMESLAAELEKQRQEIDWVLQLQNERLRTTLQKETRQQVAILLRKYESIMTSLMWQKDEDLAMATKKTMELQDCLRRKEMEIQVWQRMAKENEGTITNLNNMLKQVCERVSLSSNGAQDAESFCDSSNRGDNDQKVEEKQSKNMACKLCNARSSCIVFLPCRHLCACKSCEAFLGFCPVCESVKKASLEVFLV